MLISKFHEWLLTVLGTMASGLAAKSASPNFC
ncbi:hypothetical protein AWB75_06131 [Caballeronia catudaia]|uniref:Uncharacterized protein n=1 Tax=Caballeronia catudaia TaxID=1777136 RepID=A0A158D3H3_9BURK|nr:hypothetical protein AWB75_06131 [Caballeronia catudaia]